MTSLYKYSILSHFWVDVSVSPLKFIVGMWLDLAMKCERGWTEVCFQNQVFFLTTTDSPTGLSLSNAKAEAICDAFT